jgi:hypothetical protein
MSFRKTVKQIMDGVENVFNVKKVDHNTVRYTTTEGDVVYRLHRTDILTICKNGTVVLNTGGWRTLTTKDRLQKFLPAGIRVFSEKGVWMVSIGNSNYVFEDGMRVDNNGKVKGAGSMIKNLKMRKRIQKYAGDYVQALVDGKIGAPGNGDCWGCLMVDKEGNPGLGADHLVSHMDGKYYVPSLVWNAQKRICPLAGDAWKNDIAYLQKMPGWEKSSRFFRDGDKWFKAQIKRWICRMMYRDLGV